MTHLKRKPASAISNLNIGIIGCGWLGTRIAGRLCPKNNIYSTTTSKDKLTVLTAQNFNPLLVDLDAGYPFPGVLPWKAMSSIDILIITVPFFSRKGNAAGAMENRLRNLLTLAGNFEGQIFFTSSTGVYPQEDNIFAEDSLPVEKVPSEFLISSRYPQVNILRLGGLMGDNRQLGKYEVRHVDAPVNHIHYEDVCRVIEKMMERQVHSKLYNVVAPGHPTKREVITAQKNTDLGEIKKEMQRVISSKKMIAELEYDFSYPDPRYFHL